VHGARGRADVAGGLEVDVTVPDGVSAEIDLPGATPERVGGGHHRFAVRAGALAATAG
jgi:hypothetical protein